MPKKKSTTLPKIVQLPSGSYRAQIRMGKDNNGKRKVTSYSNNDYEKVVLWALQVQKDRENLPKEPLEYSRTFGDCLDHYIELKSKVLSPSTLREYKRIRKKHMEKLMQTKLKNVTQPLIQEVINIEAANHSPKSVRNMHGLVSAVLAMFRPDFHLHTTLPQKVKPDITIPTDEEMLQIFSAVTDTPMELPVYLAACCGLRRSEIAALKWSDINLKESTISIRGAVVLGDDGYVSKGTKTTSSKRTIVIFPFIKKILEKQTTDAEPTAPITLLNPNEITRKYTLLLQEQGIRHMRFHDLRHYTVSTMLSLNIPKNYIADYMGHETENMIDQVYGHIKSRSKDNFTQILNDHFSAMVIEL